MKKNISIFFVSSPLQILTAKAIAKEYDASRELILIFYKKNLKNLVDPKFWNTSLYLPWPRQDPLPGILGVQKRLIENLSLVENLIQDCNSLFIHSAVYDTEAINYFISFVKKSMNGKNFSFRIIPDGIVSIRRYPLTFMNRVIKKTRNLRQLLNKNLVYTHFEGDRIGSDAEFIDIIYVLKGMPHQYNSKKVRFLPLLIQKNNKPTKSLITKKALVIGQPLKGFKLMSDLNIALTTDAIYRWILEKNIVNIFYKKHPKDDKNTLKSKEFHQLQDDTLIELHLSENYYDYIIGVNSSALLLAKQICSCDSKIISFGINRIKFKNISEETDIKKLFKLFNIQIIHI